MSEQSQETQKLVASSDSSSDADIVSSPEGQPHPQHPSAPSLPPTHFLSAAVAPMPPPGGAMAPPPAYSAPSGPLGFPAPLAPHAPYASQPAPPPLQLRAAPSGRQLDELLGLPDGMYRLIFSNGCTYTGAILKGMQEGYGVHTCIDGSTYTGFRSANYRHGPGRKAGPTGGYDGSWLQDLRSGQGYTFDAQGRVIDMGFWQDDKLVQRTGIGSGGGGGAGTDWTGVQPMMLLGAAPGPGPRADLNVGLLSAADGSQQQQQQSQRPPPRQKTDEEECAECCEACCCSCLVGAAFGAGRTAGSRAVGGSSASRIY